MSKLKQGIVIDVPAWKVPVIARKKLLSQPEIAVNVTFPTTEVSEMPDKQFKAFEAKFEKDFTPAFQKMSNGWFSAMQKTIDTTEAAIEKVATDVKKIPEEGKRKAFMATIVQKTNTALQAKCKAWTSAVQKLAQKAYDAAVKASLKAMKLKVKKAKIKMIAKVALFVLLTLTAAAITIAVSVVTMGAGAALAPVVIAGIATAGKAVFGSVGEVVKSYDVLKTTIAGVESAAGKLDASAKATVKAMQKTAGKLDKLDAFKKVLSANLDSLDKKVGQLDKFIAVARARSLKQIKKIQDMADALAAASDGSPEAKKLNKDIINSQRAFDEARGQLDAIADVKKSAAEARAAFVDLKPDAITRALGKLAPALDKLKGASATVSKHGPIIKTIWGGAQKLIKAASKK